MTKPSIQEADNIFVNYLFKVVTSIALILIYFIGCLDEEAITLFLNVVYV